MNSLDAIYRRDLDAFFRMTRGGSELAPAAALFYCAKFKIESPDWLVQSAARGYCSQLNPDKKKKRGRSAEFVDRYRQDLIDFARWDELCVVREKQTEILEEVMEIRGRKDIPAYIREDREKMLAWVGHSLLRAYECASMLLQGTPAFGGPDAVKTSYRRVQECGRNQSHPFKYHVFDPDFLRAIGIEHPSFWGRGRKIVPLYNLTP